MRLPLLAVASLLVYEVEKGVRSATSCKDSRFIHIYDIEEDLLPYLDRDTLHVERKRVVCLECFLRSFLKINLNNCGNIAVPLLAVARCLAQQQAVAQVQDAVLVYN